MENGELSIKDRLLIESKKLRALAIKHQITELERIASELFEMSKIIIFVKIEGEIKNDKR